MKIFFMRHGEASFVAPSDVERELSAFGEQQVLANVERFSTVKKIVSSPVKRALQSRKLIENELSVKGESVSEWGLDANLQVQLQWLNDHGTNDLLIVSHNPLISYLCSYLCGQNLNFSTADVVCLESDYWEQGMARLIR